MSREALVLLVCCCDFRDGAEWLIPSKSLRNAVIWAFPGLLCILRMCAPRRAAAVVRPRGREKSADRRRRILISRLLIIRASVPRWKSPFPAYFKGFPAVSPLIPPYPAFLKYPVSPHAACLFFSFSLLLLLLHPHERHAELQLAYLMDAGLFIDPLAVCIDGAGGAAGPLRALAGVQAADKCLADLQFLGAQLGITLQEVFIISRVEFLLSQMPQ